MTTLRGMRSATTPPKSSSTTSASVSAPSTRPTCDGPPPCPSTAKVSATGTMVLPVSVTVKPLKKRAKFR